LNTNLKVGVERRISAEASPTKRINKTLSLNLKIEGLHCSTVGEGHALKLLTNCGEKKESEK
jgi:hypothetical protein